MKSYAYFQLYLKLYNWRQLLEGGITKARQNKTYQTDNVLVHFPGLNTFNLEKQHMYLVFPVKLPVFQVYNKIGIIKFISWIIECWMGSFLAYMLASKLAF